MDFRKNMIIIDDKIVTKDIDYYKYNARSDNYTIRYNNSNKSYNYSKNRITVITESKQVNLKDYSFFFNNTPLEKTKEVYEFTSNERNYYHIILNNNVSRDYSDKELKKVSNNSTNVLDYMKKVAEITTLNTNEGKKILCEQMNKIKIDNLDNALANYLKISNDLSKENDIDCLIFPFGCNSSQYTAVENAINNKISVIEGPPGTGKTQTILNIIANIVIRNMNCQVVSNNNPAIKNIEEKLQKYNLDFFEALLGRKKNKDLFIKNQKENIPNFDEFKDIDIAAITNRLQKLSRIVKEIYKVKKENAILIQKKRDLLLEYKYFKNLIKSQNIELLELKNFNIEKLKLMWNELISMDKISIWNKLKYIFIYKIGNFKFYSNDIKVISNSIQNEIYISDLKVIEKNIEANTNFIKHSKDYETEFIELSMAYFKKYLSLKYKDKRKIYTPQDIWKNYNEFLKDYPVILSTTYSSRNNFNNDLNFDYIIMDESSQIDVVTGTLALSSAKYAVIIGDEKQLPNVVTDKTKEQVDKIFNEYNLDKGYSYSLNSFLSSVKRIIPDVQNKMLEEHYRCHPKIINFCNKKFYNNELVIMTEDNNENDVIKVIRTNKGNHSREKASQRQVDIIKEEISKIQSNDIGIIAPYNNQVKLISENINNANIEIETVHKFQGREKDVIIISTVDDSITDFVSNANILNVAISRAKKQLLFIVTGNEIKNNNIKDFIDYVDYNNMEISNSKIYSVFDLLYKQYELERLNFFKKHNRILKYDSENLIYYLIKKVLKDYSGLEFTFYYPLGTLITDKSLLTEREKNTFSIIVHI